MAADKGSLEPLADATETEAVPTKRMRIDAAAAGGSSTGAEEVTQQTPAAAVGVGEGSSAFTSRPRPLRFPPYPMGGKKLDVRNWMAECRRIRTISAEDPRRELPTRREPKDPHTTDAVVSPTDKVMVRSVARSIVSISAITHDGSKRQSTGIIMGQRESNGRQHNLVVTCSKFISKESTLLDPLPKLHVGLPNKTILDSQFLFFNDHYGITLLEVNVDFPLESPTLGSCPNYGQKVFVLARDSEFSLRARHGEILWLEESDYIGRNYQMFLSCEVPKLHVGLPNKTILDSQFLFFNDHYGITLLEINVDFPLESPTLGSCPNYGQKVFVLARDSEFSLRARHGEILWLEESDYIGRNYQMFLSCEVPKAGNGAPVIDHDGNITGMAFYCNPNPYVLSISTIIRCIDMWMTFGHIARPLHGLGLRTFEFLDVSLQEEVCLDHGINSGFIVDKVSYDSAAESVGILRGDMIVSLDEQHALTLPQLEDHFLKLGWIFLNNPNSMIDLKLEVYDLMNHSKGSITLPLQFYDT